MQLFTQALALAAAALPFAAQAAPVSQAADPIPGKYIVVLQPETNVSSVELHHNKVREISRRNLARRDADGIERKYDSGDFKGYAGSFDEATVEELKSLPEVLFVEQDSVMHIMATVTQTNGPWNLNSLSSRTAGASSYSYDDSAGQGTYTYIVDTGIRLTHREFGGRASFGYNAVNNNNADNQGHGTHVAGTAGGSTYGVAKRTNLIAVKVFEGRDGTVSAVLSGFDWAANDIVSKSRQTTSVINMSLGGPASTAFDRAVTAAYNRGVLAVIAAGNEAQDTNNVSPARAEGALTVGNIDRNDARAVSSNFGARVDIWAPGTDILSASPSSDTASVSLTGTSMSAPLVAGLVSYLRGLEGASSAAAAKARVLALATRRTIRDARGGPNLVAYNGIR